MISYVLGAVSFLREEQRILFVNVCFLPEFFVVFLLTMLHL